MGVYGSYYFSLGQRYLVNHCYFNSHVPLLSGEQLIVSFIGFSKTIIWAKCQFLISIFHPRPLRQTRQLKQLIKLHCPLGGKWLT